ncbi:MAG: selenocysteine-specific translation elongation factor [candidate division Zixibacteria bacterium]|nr:selenocysteine-specific translation elongation factor [candidate division Zixibacteria bacterium]
MFVIGTAGHIDHGKSSIIRRLTGIDPDRLPEEKERGMTIDLGFAWYNTPKGEQIGIVDVPGHERFIRNMIAGAGGIDAVLLIVAADDGWMPQSQEHLQITQLLDLKYGIVVISKIDLVEKNWVDLVQDDLRQKLRGTFLEEAPIVRLSSTTGEGFEHLKSELDKLAERIIEREDMGKPRLYIDRSFVLPGMGGVITGTLKGGSLKLAQEVTVFPARRRARIRTLQSHNRKIDMARPGQRTAISLTGVDKEYLVRGGVISLPEIIDTYPVEPVMILTATILAESPVAIDDKRRLLLIVGTTETEGEVRFAGRTSIRPGEDDIVFFKPFNPLLSFIGDRFILRLPTPQVTVGGGIVLGIISQWPRKKDVMHYEYIRDRKILTAANLINSELVHKLFVDCENDFVHCNYSQSTINKLLDEMYQRKILGRQGNLYYRPDAIRDIEDKIISTLQVFFSNQPHIDGLHIDRIAGLIGLPAKVIAPVLELMLQNNRLVQKKNRLDLSGRIISIMGELGETALKLEEKLRQSGYSPPTVTELIGDDKTRKEALAYLVTNGALIRIGTTLVFHREHWENIIAAIRRTLDSGETLTVATLREKLHNSRKFIIPILEETDRLKITQRQDDIRIKGEKYDDVSPLL